MSEYSEVENAWFEWKRACTIERCGPESKKTLAAYARSRFRSKAIEICGSSAQMPSGVRIYCNDDAEHLELAWIELEGRLWRVRREPTGTEPGKEASASQGGDKAEPKVYKDWLYERAATEDDPVEFLQGYCTEIIKTGAREICAMEGVDLRHLKKRRTFHPLQQIVPGGAEIDLADFLLARGDVPKATEEFAQFAAAVSDEAAKFFEATTSRERVALAAQYAELPLYSPVVLLAAGCGKSVLSQQARDLEERIAGHLRVLLQGEPAEQAAEFVRQLHRRLVLLAYEWISSENGGEAPF